MIMRSEGTPHRGGEIPCWRCDGYAAFPKNAEMGGQVTQGFTRGLVCVTPLGLGLVIGD